MKLAQITAFSSILTCLAASTAMAQSTMETSQAMYVERSIAAGNGHTVQMIEPAETLIPGDRVVLIVEWPNAPAPRGLTVASAVPRALAFQRSSSDDVEVSTDGGRNWGRLGLMQVVDKGSTRLASPEDVTHLRWRIAPGRAAKGHNRITYSAIVR